MSENNKYEFDAFTRTLAIIGIVIILTIVVFAIKAMIDGVSSQYRGNYYHTHDPNDIKLDDIESYNRYLERVGEEKQ